MTLAGLLFLLLMTLPLAACGVCFVTLTVPHDSQGFYLPAQPIASPPTCTVTYGSALEFQFAGLVQIGLAVALFGGLYWHER